MKTKKTQSSFLNKKEIVFIIFIICFFMSPLFVRVFALETFKIPSKSMIPTVFPGDYILVNKLKYGFRIPLTKTWVAYWNPLKRGDVVVFIYPKEERLAYIKRVVGLEGDKILFSGGRIFLNEHEIEIQEANVPSFISSYVQDKDLQIYHEILESKTHFIALSDKESLRQEFDGVEIEVPKGHFFVLGDNRDYSSDSRVWGNVPIENIIGKPTYILLSLDLRYGRFHLDRLGLHIN